MSTITREQALEKLRECISNKNLQKHCFAVEACMVYYADIYKVPETEKSKWAIAGLLHDADWEKFPDEHPNHIVNWLKQNGVDEDIINAIAAHGFNFGVEPKTLMAKVLRAVDELSGFIVAVSLVKGRNLDNVDVRSVKKKLKDKSFARGVSREDIFRGAHELGVDLDTHIQNVIEALKSIRDVLEL